MKSKSSVKSIAWVASVLALTTSLTAAAALFFVLDAGFKLSLSVDSGYYLAIAPMLPGEHTLHFHGEIDGFVQDVTYELTVGF
jgi:hypothetical protein